MFYRHHFGELAERLGVSLQHFYHPNKQVKKGTRSGPKTFNCTYVRLILRSASFREVTRGYLEQFMKDNLKERRKKIHKLIGACRKVTEMSPVQIKFPAPLTFDDLKSDGALGGSGWLLTDESQHWGW
jgi:hypothetical protein